MIYIFVFGTIIWILYGSIKTLGCFRSFMISHPPPSHAWPRRACSGLSLCLCSARPSSLESSLFTDNYRDSLSLPPSLPPSFLLLFQWCWVGLSFSFALQCPVAFEKIVQHTLQVLRAADQLLIWDEFSLSNLFEGTIFHREDWEQLLSTLMFSETMLVPHLRHSTVSCQCYAEASLTNHWS